MTARAFRSVVFPRRDFVLVASLAIAASAWAVPAAACSYPPKKMTSPQVRDHARAQYARASAVIDGEVIIPAKMLADKGQIPMAVLRVLARPKGPPVADGERLALVYFSSCDIALLREGERVRILIEQGIDLARALQGANGPPTAGEGGQEEFNAEIDRIAGLPRPVGASAFPGEELPPDAKKPN